MDQICKVYERKFETVGHQSTWPRYKGPKIQPNPQLKREVQQPKRCGLCRSEGHSRKQYPYKAGPSSQ